MPHNFNIHHENKKPFSTAKNGPRRNKPRGRHLGLNVKTLWAQHPRSIPSHLPHSWWTHFFQQQQQQRQRQQQQQKNIWIEQKKTTSASNWLHQIFPPQAMAIRYMRPSWRDTGACFMTLPGWIHPMQGGSNNHLGWTNPMYRGEITAVKPMYFRPFMVGQKYWWSAFLDSACKESISVGLFLGLTIHD